MSAFQESQAVLALALTGSIDTAMQLHKGLQGKPDATAQAIEKAQAQFTPDQVVRVFGKMIAIVKGFNESSYGFYPGSRYPLMLKQSKGTFPYSTSCVEAMPANTEVSVLLEDGSVQSGVLATRACKEGVSVKLHNGSTVTVALDSIEIA